ncbi:SDR family NAD(P)-dependent oxidoreductase [Streptomyces sp. NBC_01007]|nr:SDR family NAD(P)-dependent oxidoreductase [Streptomyces sp. NBC_01007]
MQQQAPGAMLAVSLGEAEVSAFVTDDCVLAAVNSPRQTVLSGTHEAIDRAAAALTGRGVRHRRLATSHAFHSPMMEPMLAEFEREVARLELGAPRTRFVSNVTGVWITPEQATSASYWAQHIRGTVRFSAGLSTLLRDEPDAMLLEVGPGAAIRMMVADHPEGRERILVPSMRHAREDRDDVQVARESLARLWVNGAPVRWSALHEHRSPRKVPLPAYAFDHKRHWIERAAQRPSDQDGARLFRPVLRKAALPAATEPGTARWLVLTDAAPAADRWTARLRESGEQVVTVTAGTAYERTAEDAFRIRPETAGDYELLVDALQEQGGPRTWNVLYLWNVEAGASPEQAQVRSLDGLVLLARAVGPRRGADVTRLAVVTRGLTPVAGQPSTAPSAQALVLGPVRTLPLEYPALTASVIDFEAEPDGTEDGFDAAFPSVVAEVCAGLPESLVAYRGTVRHVERVEQLPTGSTPARSRFRRGGVYLVTGAFGGVGTEIAGWLARNHQARLVLTGRTPLPPRGQWAELENDPSTEAEIRRRLALIRRLESAGAEVHVECFDVTDREALGQALGRAEARFGPVEGVVHAAGLAGGALAQFQRSDAMRRVLAPKLDGTLALASALREHRLAFFAVFSSVSALLGNVGQVDYCAANAFLDGWACSSEAPEGAVTISWDTWRGVGMAAPERLPAAVVAAHADQEWSGMPAAAALSVFEQAVSGGQRRVVVSTGSLPDRLAARGARRPEPAGHHAGTPVERSRAEVEETLLDIWRLLFGRAEIDVDANFFELGGDSLLVIEAGRQIKERLQTTLPVSDLFKYPTVAHLVDRLSPEQTAQAPAARPTVRPEPADDTAIAVIGMAARFPGADNVEEFWQNLVDGVESLVPTSEPAESAIGPRGRYVAVAGAPNGVDQFDPAFFGFSAREAEVMDPQQRLLLMCSYEALEDSGYDPRNYPGPVAVYVGAAMSSYLLNNLVPHRGTSDLDPLFVGMGNDKDFAATQISYRLNLRGPSVSVSTACSSSLVAIAHACRSLAAGECDAAIAGGAKVRVPDRGGYLYQEGNIFSPDGHCRPFDADANGTVFASGAGIVVLKRLNDALRDGDTIRAVIRGSAVNNDGADKVGFTAPSVRGQANVIYEAQQLAKTDARTIGYIEAHGTATTLGDPIEIAALTEAFRTTTQDTGYCTLGSVKSNIGHLDTAAGIAGFIKTVLTVQHATIPATLHYQKPNPRTDLHNTPFHINNHTQPWTGPTPRRAGISSFGMGGTNAHIIIEQAPPTPETPEAPEANRHDTTDTNANDWQILTTTARTPTSLTTQQHRLTTHLTTTPHPLPDIAHTLQTGRHHHPHRAAILARTTTETTRPPITGQAHPNPRTAYLLTGQGNPYPSMAHGLYTTHPTFRTTLDTCTQTIEQHTGHNPLKALYTPDATSDHLTDTEHQQPLLFAIQYAMAQQWRAWGIEPHALIGHSLGELVAATLAEVWTLDDALRLVCLRGRLMQQQAPGAMLAVSLGEAEVSAFVTDDCVLAAVNSPRQTVLSGTHEAIDRAAAALTGRGVRHRRLATSHAFHSPMMEPMLAEFEREVARLELGAPRTRFVSNVTGVWITPEQATSASYWAQHIRGTVRFSAGLSTLLRDEPDAMLLEVGPGAAIRMMVADHPEGRERILVPSMRHAREDRDDVQVARESLARLWVNGAPVRWSALHEHRSPRKVPLPAYAFDHKRHWIERAAQRPSDQDGARLFRPVLRKAALPAATEPGTARWLVLTDAAPAADRWTARLRESGEQVVTVTAGTAYERTAEDAFRIRPETAGDYELLVDALQEQGGPRTWNVLYLWNVEAGASPEQAQVRSLDGLVLLARAVGPRRGADVTRLAVVTRGLTPVAGQPSTAPSAQALVLGPVRTLPLEYPALTASVIDFEAEPDGTEDGFDAAFPSVVAEVCAGLPESLVAYRGTVRHVERVEQLPTGSTPARSRFRRGGVYLVTGAFGGVGTEIAGWLARNHQARLVLTGRTPLPPRGQWAELENDPSTEAEIRRRLALIRRLESAGAEVHVECFDVTDREALGQALGRAEARFGPVEGVVHAAGLAGGALAQFQRSDAMRRVLAPKLDGTLALASALREHRLAFFAVFSSVSALLGNVGQVDYCAANAFLDGWACSSEAPEGAVTISWDTWRGVGMAAPERLPAAVVAAHADQEWSGMPAAAALSVFEQAVSGGQRRVVVSTGSLPDRLAARGARRPEPAGHHAGTPVERSRAEVEETLLDIWRLLFGRAEIDVDANFFELGGDSLLVIEAGRQIKERLQTTLPVSDLFKYPTVAHLVDRLSPEQTAQAPAARPTVRPEPADDTAIAVIGMAARFPGADNVEEFWQNLVDGVESLVPTSEPAESAIGPRGRYVAVAGAPNGVDQFDPAFFGFSAREAEVMDPQQRLLLMCSYEALEDSGYDPRNYPGPVAVYVGAAMSSYLLNNLVPHRGTSDLDPLFVGMGNDKDFAATQISYRLNLRGPSVSVSTACSSSLVAIAHACRSLAAGECDAAIAGGAKVRVPDRGGYLYQEGNIFSPDGHCRPFDADANGTVFASGAGIVVLKRLNDALRDGDTIRAVIRGSAVNNDGADKVGFTAPSVRGQANVIYEAQQLAKTDARTIGYIEAHGTATTLGDPIEIAALTEAFRTTTQDTGYCTLGSVKSNIGHLDTAAGIAGFIKTVLTVQHATIPATLHYQKPNPRTDLHNTPFHINNHTQPWTGPTPRRAGISSFGMGGTNAHIIIEQAPPTPETPEAPEANTARPTTDTNANDWQILTTTARTPTALTTQQHHLTTHLTTTPHPLPDIAHTLQTGRHHHPHRAAILARTTTETTRPPITGQAHPNPRTAYLLTGQGNPYPSMAHGLYTTHPTFRTTLDTCTQTIEQHTGHNPLKALYTPDATSDHLTDTEHQQPLLFAIQYAMAQQWRAWGIEPHALIGHSLGELVAATLAEVWTLDDALRLVCLRGRLMQQQAPGAMLAVSLGEAEVSAFVTDDCVLAAVNSPRQTVLSGTHEAIDRAAAALTGRGVRHRRLATSHAFHSPMMEPMLAEFEREVARLELGAPRTRFVSNVTGVWITPEQATSASYWAQHIRGTVRFSAGLSTLLRDEPDAMLLEVGPGAAIRMMVADHPEGRERILVPSMRHAREDRDDVQVARESLARLWVNGAPVRWSALHEHRSPRKVPLPAYAFDHKRHWIERAAQRPSDQDGARLFRPVLRKAALPAATEPGTARWLVLTDAAPAADRWTARLRESGEQVVTVTAGTAYERTAEDAFRIRPETAGDYELLVDALQEQGGPRTWNVLYLWNVEAGASPEQAQVRSLDGLVLLARAVGPRRGADVTRLAVVTRGLTPVAGQPSTAPSAQALVLGPVRTLPLEYPALTASVIDFEAEPDGTEDGFDAAFPSVVAEVCAGLPESLVAYRGTVRHVERVEQLPTGSTPARSRFRRGGVYLVTGAFGGVGTEIAGWLARNHQARLVLTGRTPLPPRGQWAELENDPSTEAEIRRRLALIRRLESAGAEVHVECFDVTDREALGQALGRAEARFGPVEGVVHAAGLAGGALAQFQRSDAMRRVLAPKLDGTLALASALREHRLAFFAVFSSVSALLGNVGQVDYCAANAFLDGWACSSEAPEGAVTISWDTWRGVGMAAPERLPAAVVAAHADQEWSGMPAAAALSVFEQAVSGGQRRVVVSTGSLPDRLAARGARRPEPAGHHAGTPVERSRAEVEETLLDIWRLLFGRAEIDVDANFFELGGDSLLVIEAGRQIKERLQTTLPVSDLFKYPTVAHLVDRLSPEQTAQAPAARPTVRPEPADDTAIAVIGMAARFPGADNVEEFWQNLVDGVESLVPTSEPAESAIGPRGRYVAVAGAPNGVDQFDPAFFGFSAREAEVMDPQQRLLLMCSYEALEDSGYDPRNYPGPVAVYVGAAMSSYLLNNLVPHRGTSDLDPLFVGMGNDKDFAATQISYRLNLRGPSVSVSTACSSSLVAIAHACRSLAAGECDAAIAGGAKVRVPDRGGYLYQEGNIFSPDGHCRPFDADANGTVFASGAGIVVLKRLNDALRDGDTIRAVIRGSAVNNDGADKVGFTAPSVRGQANVIYEAQQLAKTDARTIGYIEAHGTATTLGDPIEIAALTEAFRTTTQDTGYCTLGSVKSNIGHLDTAAGIAGFIKTVLTVQHATIPATLHYQKPNPRTDLHNTPFHINNHTQPWTGPTPRRAGISSFGMGGTNAHIIIEQAPPTPETPEANLKQTGTTPPTPTPTTGRSSPPPPAPPPPSPPNNNNSPPTSPPPHTPSPTSPTPSRPAATTTPTAPPSSPAPPPKPPDPPSPARHTPTHEPPTSSPDKATPTPPWPTASTPPTPPSAPPSTPAPKPSNNTPATTPSRPSTRPMPRATTSPTPSTNSPSFSPSSTPWPSSGAPGASSPTPSSATASANSSRPPSPRSGPSTTPYASSACEAG